MRVKAAYIYNFCSFTRWPDSTFKESTSPLVIGILGKDPMKEHLASAIAGKSIQGHELQLMQSDKLEDLQTAHVVYISDSQTAEWNRIFPEFKGRPILTVGNGNAFTHNGGIISFYPDAGRIHFEINLTIANAAGLKLDSRLLQLARITRPGKEQRK